MRDTRIFSYLVKQSFLTFLIILLTLSAFACFVYSNKFTHILNIIHRNTLHIIASTYNIDLKSPADVRVLTFEIADILATFH